MNHSMPDAPRRRLVAPNQPSPETQDADQGAVWTCERLLACPLHEKHQAKVKFFTARI